MPRSEEEMGKRKKKHRTRSGKSAARSERQTSPKTPRRARARAHTHARTHDRPVAERAMRVAMEAHHRRNAHGRPGRLACRPRARGIAISSPRGRGGGSNVPRFPFFNWRTCALAAACRGGGPAREETTPHLRLHCIKSTHFKRQLHERYLHRIVNASLPRLFLLLLLFVFTMSLAPPAVSRAGTRCMWLKFSADFVAQNACQC